MVKIHFAAFWVSFDPEVNFFRDSLLEGMDTVVTQDNPDIVFFSCFGDPQLDRYPNAKRVFFTGENLRPKPEADLSLSFDYDSSTNVRTPLYLLTLHELQAGEEEILYRPKEYDGRKLFCAFIYSHGVVGTRRGVYQDGVALRNRLFHALSKYKKVDSAGTFMNNMDMGATVPDKRGHGVGGKLEFLQNYKFAFSIENSSTPGYTTEKILHPALAGSLPIYWGNPHIDLEFNPKSFLALKGPDDHDVDEMVDRVAWLDSDDGAYAAVLAQPYVLRRDAFSVQISRVKERLLALLTQ